MVKKILTIALLLSDVFMTQAQSLHPASLKKSPSVTQSPDVSLAEKQWVDSVFKTLTPERRIAQLIFIRAHSNLGQDHIDHVTGLIKDKGVGGLVFFQGGPERQANLTNYYQSISQVPLFISIDGEWGLGMRLDSVTSFPRQLLLGAVQDSTLIYRMGQMIGEQCKRMGIQINFAPVVDINNNPDNPVINDRSFGENKYRVAQWGIQYMKGMQSTGILACAKHFPGHGDTNADSHKSLPVISKSMTQLQQLELYPFQQMIRAGVSAVMVAHLYIPAIDKRVNRPTSLSYNNVTRLLKQKLGYTGLVFTDALEMQGVAKYFTHGQASVEALLAGDDVLLLPEDVDESIAKIKSAIDRGILHWTSINDRVKKLLHAKYKAGLDHWQAINTDHLTDDLNAGTDSLNAVLFHHAVTVLSNENNILPLRTNDTSRMACVVVGASANHPLIQALSSYHPVDDYYFNAGGSYTSAATLAAKLKGNYDKVIIAVCNYNRFPAGNFGLSDPEVQLINQLQEEMRSTTLVFGNPYAIRNFCKAPSLVAAYEDDTLMYRSVADVIFGRSDPQGKLPVTVCKEYPSGIGLSSFEAYRAYLPYVQPTALHIDERELRKIDSIAKDGIAKKAYPGCVVMAVKDGRIFYQKAFGYLRYDKKAPVTLNTIYDLASVTKICATTLSCMRLYDEGKLDLNKTLGDYLPWLRGSDKARLKIKDVMLHQAGFVAWIPFYKRTLTDEVHPNMQSVYQNIRDGDHHVRVAEDLYLRDDYIDTMFGEIRDSKLGKPLHYIYSDNDFILMGKIVERLTGQSLDEYVKHTFYDKLGMLSTGFKPRERYELSRIAPTECEQYFRLQCLQGDVHDPGAAMFGGVAGHAGLFSDAYDLGVLMQMLLNGGEWQGVSYIKPETIKLFTAYGSPISRRGIGFDKPEKDHATASDPYPCKSCSDATFGHTGYTGTCIWVDPQYHLTYIFLSNRVQPDGGTNILLSHLNIRSKIQETLYRAMGVGK